MGMNSCRWATELVQVVLTNKGEDMWGGLTSTSLYNQEWCNLMLRSLGLQRLASVKFALQKPHY